MIIKAHFKNNGVSLAVGLRGSMPAKPPKFDARTLMEMAVRVMKGSEQEPRKDGKVVPLVGVVIYTAGGTVDTAYRGEIRDGDHAEYTLLERKYRDTRLDDSTLFTTLEPCTQEARDERKIGCAQRIVLARIKEVWVGIEDPDPTVDRKGIEFLRANGVAVHMFDRDLQEDIRAANKEYIESRTKAPEQETVEISPPKSRLETAAPHPMDFSDAALKLYREQAQIEDEIHSTPFQDRLIRLGLLKERDGTFYPTGFGTLLFGNQPRDTAPQAGLLGTIQFPDGTVHNQDFNLPLVLIPSEFEKWFTDKLPSIIDTSQMVRREIPAFPTQVVREAVVNALVHRDYEITGAKCQILITEDIIKIKSPGGPPYPITLEQMQSFNAPMLSRNPVLHYVFAQMKLAEERGIGLKTFKSTAEDLDLPLPRYSFNDPYLDLTFFRNTEGVLLSLSPDFVKSLNRDERAGLQFLTTQTFTTKSEYANHMQFNPRKAQRHLSKFAENGLLIRMGSGSKMKYQIRLPYR